MRFLEEGLAALIASMLAVGVMSLMLHSGPDPETSVTSLRELATLPTESGVTATTAARGAAPSPTPAPRSPVTPAPPPPAASDTDAVANATAQRVICRALTAAELREFAGVYEAQRGSTTLAAAADAWLKVRFLQEVRQCFLQYAGGRS